MTFCSYAQNFEDILLWRAFRDLQAGFYIDVGAAHPDTDSVTRAFYDRGWRGINVEPVAELARRLAASRPRDITLAMALGAEAGEKPFYVIAETGLSTLDPDIAAQHQAASFAVRQDRATVSTLAAICREHAPPDIHFLKIDVEGAEGAVLAGADFAQFRPWVVLVEATAPGSTEQTHEAWEPLLLSAGYRFLYFDGLNRFYGADEHLARLEPHFRVPVNVFDDFVRPDDITGGRRAAELEAEIGVVLEQNFVSEANAAEAAQRAERAEQRAQEANARLAAWERRTDAADLRASQAEARLAAQASDHHRTMAALKSAQEDAASLRASTSWRITAPLRRSVSLFRVAAQARRSLSLPRLGVHPAQPLAAPNSGAEIALPPPPRGAALSARQTRTVHQFHAGSGYGDAITNAMLLIRARLRAMGYRSDIYVVHRDEALRDELLTFDELPSHDDYVLLFHHSMGFDGYERVVSLPAPKVLIYHNITPVEFFEGKPDIQQYIRLGRQQLADLRDRVVASLADSVFNTIELHSLGFANPHPCTLLFDLDTLRQRFAGPRAQAPRPFTILFVGRVVSSKGQLDLVEAFARLLALNPPECRLVIVGRQDGAGEDYARSIHDRIRALGLDDRITMAGLVSDEDLQSCYRNADLYLSLSMHEGFGVPLVEAAVAGIPVLAWPAGAVAYTLGGGEGLLASRDPDDVAARVHGLMRDPQARAALVAFQAEALSRYALADHLAILGRALATAGAAPPLADTSGTILRENLRFDVTGHVNGTYSLAAINRTLARALDEVRPGTVRLLPVEGQPTDRVDGVPNGERPVVAALASRLPHPTGPIVVISQHYPVYVPDKRGDCLLAYLFWEETLLPAATVRILNEKFDGVLAPSRFVADALLNSGVSIPVINVGFAPDLASFEAVGREPPTPRVNDGAYTFLHVSSAFPRKGIDVLLAAYAQAFRATDPVRLIIKAFPNPHNDTAERIARLRATDPALPEIQLIDRDMTSPELLALYQSADAVVLPTRGEGFNLPAAEAMAAARPLIVTGYGGHMDFCDSSNARLVAFRLAPSISHVASFTSLWAEPDQDDLAQAMRDVLRDPQAAAQRARLARDNAARLASQTEFVGRIGAASIRVLQAPPWRALRLTMITTFSVRCGIAEYARFLIGGMLAAEPDLHITVLADTRAPIRSAPPAGVDVRTVWPLNMPQAVDALRTACAAADPDVIMLQHQPGLLGWMTLGCVITALAAPGRIILVTLHNTAHLLDIPEEERQIALSGLIRASRVVVHGLADVNRLATLGLVANVVLIPHGAPDALPRAEEQPLTPRDTVTLGSYGFLLRDKGIVPLIEAAGILRKRWPRLRLNLVNAEYDNDESRAELAAAQAAIKRAGLAGAAELVTAYLPDEESRALLAQCNIVVLPYQRSREGASGALRIAMSAGGTVAVTPITLFDDAGDAVFRLPGTDPDSIAAGLETLLNDRALRSRIRDAAGLWMAERKWDVTGARILGMSRGLLASAPDQV